MSNILISVEGALGHIHLNRPQALNALTMEMLQDISAALTGFADNPAIAAVLLTGAGDRSLCAGGDIRALYEHRDQGPAFGADYFRAEYSLNYQVATFPKPYIAFMDGITMGGGVGLSAHGTVRIVTDRTRLAMPETAIGLFPDIGASWLFSHAPGELGTYLALTGQNIDGADAVFAKLADEYVPHDALMPLHAKLAALPPTARIADIKSVVSTFAQSHTAPLASHLDEINHSFKFDTVEDILAALSKSDSAFAKDTASQLGFKSPTSLKVTLRLIRLGRQTESVKSCLERDYTVCQNFLKGPDLYEGIRAAIVDKDRRPHWQPKTLQDVNDSMVDTYFQPGPKPLFL